MLECKTCHTDEKMSKINMGDTCGQDCFACHNAKKLEDPKLKSAHHIIKSCISCHTSLEKNSKILDKSIFLKDASNPFLNK